MVKDCLWKQALKWEGEPVLVLSLRTPELDAESRGARRINRYYGKLAQIWKARWETSLFPSACAALAEARAASRPFEPWSVTLDYRVTQDEAGLLSLYVDAVERSTGRPLTVRTADTWDLASGVPHLLTDFLPPTRLWRQSLLAELTAQSEARLQSGESFFYADAPARVRRFFSPQRFYLTGDSLAVFFPMLSLAPAAEGIPVFLLPRPDAAGEQNSQAS